MLKFLCPILAVLVILLCVSTAHAQDTKVVVIPLGGDDIDQCQVATACDAAGQATVSCASGDVEIPCTVPKLVFVTSTTHTGNLGGLAGADAICQELANDAGLFGEFKAWLSDDVDSPNTRFIRSSSPYILTNGTVVASSYSDLVDGSLLSPINITEDNQAIPASLVWTNTVAAGGISPTPTSDCAGWTESPSLDIGVSGSTLVSDGGWTVIAGSRCEFAQSLYCFEQ